MASLRLVSTVGVEHEVNRCTGPLWFGSLLAEMAFL